MDELKCQMTRIVNKDYSENGNGLTENEETIDKPRLRHHLD
mgnify:CR=1 FL=1